MSQSPLTTGEADEQDGYFSAFNQLAQHIRDGMSFSGRERHCAFLNTRNGSFADVSAISGFGMPNDGRGMALTDWDHDGDLDVWISNRTAPRIQFLQNRIPGSNSPSIALRLEGDPARGCPRDAIGSRVELILTGTTGPGGRRVKTLHAGEGLMSQSSKWLHFGLGAEDAVGQVLVHWSGGAAETFEGVSPGGRWLLKQGSGTAVRSDSRAPVTLDPQPLALPEPTDVARIPLSQPLKTPELVYRDLSGTRQRLADLSDQHAVLVNFWATWCAPCVAELKSFAAADEMLQREGLTVLALNVDHLDPGSMTTPEAAAAALQRLEYHLPAGIADPELINLLSESIASTVYLHRTMPVPISFLVDRGGWLSAIYKGPVDLEQVLDDRRQLGGGFEAARAAALPFPGIWAVRNLVSNPITNSAAYLEGGYLHDARRVLLDYLDKPESNSTTLSPADQAQRSGQVADVHFQLGRIAELEPDPMKAIHHYETALTHRPRHIPALNQLAWLLATTADPAVRDGDKALDRAQFLMQAPGATDNPSLLATLAAAQAAAGRFPEAASTTRRILTILESRGLPPDAPDPATHRHRLQLFEQNQPLSQ